MTDDFGLCQAGQLAMTMRQHVSQEDSTTCHVTTALLSCPAALSAVSADL